MTRMVVFGSLIAGLWTSPAGAQSARDVQEIYCEGPVWHMIYVRTLPGMREAYLEDLSGTWTRQVTMAERLGFVLRHHVVTKWPADPQDWDVLIVEVFPNMAAYDTFWRDWAEVDARVVADRVDERSGNQATAASRTLLGVQIAREIGLRPSGADSTRHICTRTR